MTQNTIPASALVAVNPGVIGASGGALNLVGLVLTQNTRVPTGQVLSLPTLATVISYFGAASQEASVATNYFAGFSNSTAKPGAILFYQQPSASVAAYLRGGNVSGLTLTQLQALTGTLSLTLDGTVKSAASFSLSAATSFSSAAALIATALAATVTFDSQSGAFVITSATTGATSTITAATGTMAAGLALTTATGAIASQGSIALTPAVAMANVLALTSNFATFMTTYEPVTADKIAFAAWASSQSDDFLYVMWTTNITLTNTVPATASAEYAIAQAEYNGTFSIYAPVNGANAAAFVCGAAASINFNATNGRTDFAYMAQAGLAPDVTTALSASNLIANGSNFYGAYGTSAQSLNLLQPGQISGVFQWADTYLNQVWLNAALQGAVLNYLASAGSVPYTSVGYSGIRAACSVPIAAALNFGAIRGGVPLSAVQAAEVNAAAGFAIDSTITNVGYYLLIEPASAQVRAARQSPAITLFYTDGQSIQTVTLASLEVA
jgi:hypothetical protein